MAAMGMTNPRQVVVLVVEDEALIRLALVEHLRDEGLLVIEAQSGLEALAVLCGGQVVDVLVTDIRLGTGMDGWAVADACRQKTGDMAIIYVSANPSQPDREVAGSAFVTKPYAVEKVLRVCRELLPTSH
jgi:CheY-like chemotaxis protein